jgi:hypothetical protein
VLVQLMPRATLDEVIKSRSAKGRQATVQSEHATVAEALAALETVSDGADWRSEDAIELFVVDDDWRQARVIDRATGDGYFFPEGPRRLSGTPSTCRAVSSSDHLSGVSARTSPPRSTCDLLDGSRDSGGD